MHAAGGECGRTTGDRSEAAPARGPKRIERASLAGC
jgi:hypothetical protein